MNRTQLHKSIQEKSKLTFARSSGNGGQNVNKVNTKVHASLSIDDIEGISPEEKDRLKSKLSSIINVNGELYLDADDERLQSKNRSIALERLENKIADALKPTKKRKKTKPTKASIEKRLKIKKRKSEIKANRKTII